MKYLMLVLIAVFVVLTPISQPEQYKMKAESVYRSLTEKQLLDAANEADRLCGNISQSDEWIEVAGSSEIYPLLILYSKGVWEKIPADLQMFYNFDLIEEILYG